MTRHKKKNRDKRSSSKRAPKGESRGLSLKKLYEEIYNTFAKNPTKLLNYKQVASKIGVRDNKSKRVILDHLFDLKEDDLLTEESRGKYRLKTLTQEIEGVFHVVNREGEVRSTEMDEPIKIPRDASKQALPNDIVKVQVFAKREGHKLHGEITEIVERAKEQFVGTVSISNGYIFFCPTQKIGYDLFIAPKDLKDAKDGQKAIAKITHWPTKGKNPHGKIIKVLGDSGDHATEMHAIIEEYNLPTEFPKAVEAEADAISIEISKEEIARRRDFRSVPTFTIDPVDAKDFDDAISVQVLENGHIEVGVHIADVSHYVTPNSKLEEEAYNRATSVYLVDRVIPMLPERLSNGVCSLRPEEEKLCFSAVFILDKEAQLHNTWFGKTVIYSDKRFAYEDAQDIIDGGDSPLKEEILTINSIAEQLREERFQKGSIDFDRQEVKFDLAENGDPLGVYFKESLAANKLIEEFMLLANKKVAEYAEEKNLFIYRIHDEPDASKLNDFNLFIKRFGLGIKTSSPIAISTSMNKMLAKVSGKGEQNVVETLAIRTMSKAEYSTHNIGHCGLGFKHYSHFTSPIRRYPDMMVHRLLFGYLTGNDENPSEDWEGRCKHSSAMEYRASVAERSSIKFKQVEFMKLHIGEVFEGVISGVTDWGAYVELNDNKCEGMVPTREMRDDYYFFDKKEFSLIGQSSGKRYQLGDCVTVKVTRTNLEKRQLDFRFID